MKLEAISVGADAPNVVNVVIEVPIGGEPIKYELDKASGALFVDRFLYTPCAIPAITVSFQTRCRAMATRAT